MVFSHRCEYSQTSSLSCCSRSELHILQKLLLVQQALVNFNFKECVTALYVSHKHLQRWKTSNSEHVPLVCVRAVLLVALTRPWQPKAHGWLECFQSTLLSKATMFFHLPFSRQEASIGGNMQRWCACTRHNLSARMDTFAQTMDASVSLVLDAQGLLSTPEEMYLHYCCPNVQSVGEECTGLQLWPMIFCSSKLCECACPQAKDVSIHLTFVVPRKAFQSEITGPMSSL